MGKWFKRGKRWISFIYQIGIQEYKDGSKYEGEWKGDIRSGYGNFHHKEVGTMLYSNDEKYNGGWLNDQRNGKGVLFLLR